MRTENFVRDASHGALLNFVNGIGDTNPIFRDQEYAAFSKYGSIIGHPCAPYMRHWSGRTRWGLPGVHGFFAGNDWEYFRNLRPGDAVNCVERVLDVQERQSRYSETLVIQFVETIYTNQRDDLLARVVGWCTRHQRRASRERGQVRQRASPPRVHAGRTGGNRPAGPGGEGQGQPDPLLRRHQHRRRDGTRGPGPVVATGRISVLVGTGRSSAHGVLLREALRHPDHFFRNPESGGGLEYTGIGHLRDSVAEAVGRPWRIRLRSAERVSWMGTLVTNWMGDDAFLKRLRVECRRFNVYGDTQWCKGRVIGKHIHDGAPLVDLEIWAENQRGEVTARGRHGDAAFQRPPRAVVHRRPRPEPEGCATQ